MNLAFEYQGLQHYTPVGHFGGDRGLEYRIKLDSKKQRLCSKNAVTLVEWSYTEPICASTLRDKLAFVGISLAGDTAS